MSADRHHGRVFAFGVTAMAGVVLVAGGLTWASQGDGSLDPVASSPEASAAVAARAKVGECGILLDGRPATMSLARARTITMLAAVGQQVLAPDVQTARAIDAALTERGKLQPKVTGALALLAREYPDPASEQALAQLRALSTPGGLTCAFPPSKVKKEKADRTGLTPRAAGLRASVLDAFGKLPTSGWDRPGVTDAPPVGAAADGRAFDVMFSPASAAARVRGWAVAHWIVAGAGRHGVATVSYDGWHWSSGAGWRPLSAPPVATHPAPTPGAPDLVASRPTAAESARSVAARYLDRVHVTLVRGS